MRSDETNDEPCDVARNSTRKLFKVFVTGWPAISVLSCIKISFHLSFSLLDFQFSSSHFEIFSRLVAVIKFEMSEKFSVSLPNFRSVDSKKFRWFSNLFKSFLLISSPRSTHKDKFYEICDIFVFSNLSTNKKLFLFSTQHKPFCTISLKSANDGVCELSETNVKNWNENWKTLNWNRDSPVHSLFHPSK